MRAPNESSDLLARVYGELRQLAQRELARDRPHQTLQATALVHEAWMRLEREERDAWEGRAQFFVAAAHAMRRILVDRARARGRLKGAGSHKHVAFDERALDLASGGEVVEGDALLELDDALAALRAFDPKLAELVELRAFTGLTETEAASVLGRSERSVRRDWRAARLWLLSRIRGSAAPANGTGGSVDG